MNKKKKSGTITKQDASNAVLKAREVLKETKKAHEQYNKGKKKVFVRVNRNTLIEKWI